jgi:hypothetical protein
MFSLISPGGVARNDHWNRIILREDRTTSWSTCSNFRSQIVSFELKAWTEIKYHCTAVEHEHLSAAQCPPGQVCPSRLEIQSHSVIIGWLWCVKVISEFNSLFVHVQSNSHLSHSFAYPAYSTNDRFISHVSVSLPDYYCHTDRTPKGGPRLDNLLWSFGRHISISFSHTVM